MRDNVPQPTKNPLFSGIIRTAFRIVDTIEAGSIEIRFEMQQLLCMPLHSTSDHSSRTTKMREYQEATSRHLLLAVLKMVVVVGFSLDSPLTRLYTIAVLEYCNKSNSPSVQYDVMLPFFRFRAQCPRRSKVLLIPTLSVQVPQGVLPLKAPRPESMTDPPA